MRPAPALRVCRVPSAAALAARRWVTKRSFREGSEDDMDRLMEERIAKNDATFRDANERIGAAAEAYGVVTPAPFICECADPTCSKIVPLEIEQYEEIRANPRHFLNIPGHQAAAQGAAVVVAEREGYVIVEKIGHAGDVVESRDERSADERREPIAASDD
jgi:hypothetical protein